MILLPVPRQHYAAMVKALAELMNGSQLAPTTAVPGWSDDDVERLKGLPLNDTARAMLDLVAEAPDQNVHLDEIRARAGVDYKVARGQLGGFSKLLKSRLGRTDWPIRVEQRDGLLAYSCTATFARQWQG